MGEGRFLSRDVTDVTVTPTATEGGQEEALISF